MSDIQLKKKVQLKQKQETPVVSLKRKGETAPIATPPVGSASKTAAATATVAAAVQAATSASANTVAAKSNVAGNGVAASGSSKVKSDAAQPSNNGETPTATPSSNTSGNNQKIGGKAWPWLLICAALIACLAFGAYKYLNSSGSSAENQELIAGLPMPDNTGSTNVNTSGTSVSGGGDNSTNSESSASSNSQVSNNETTNASSSTDVGGYTNASVSSDANAIGANTGVKTVATNASSATQGRQISTNSADASAKAMSSNNSGSVVDNLHNYRVASVSSVSDTHAICLFAFDSANLEDNAVLNDIIVKAKQSNCKVIIDAYADEVGSSEYNQLLSQRRANAVKNYFTSRGVNSAIITANGNGESTQYSSRAENRRADIKLQ